MSGITIKEPENLADFLNALASAILAWQGVETNLFLIFIFLVGPHENPAVLSAVYHSVINLDSRLKMINAAAAVVLKDDSYLKEWEKLREQIRKKAVRRNNLAHFCLVSNTDINGHTEALLKPSIFNVNAKPDCKFNTKEIDDWRKSFITLASELSKFIDKLPSGLHTDPL